MNPLYCPKHARQMRRHGSAERGSYSAADLKPYLWAARRWIKQHIVDRTVQAAIGGLTFTAARGVRDGLELLGAKAEARAANVLKRLARARVPGERLLATILATWALAEDDTGHGRATARFRHVQIAKQANRIAPPVRPGWAAPQEGKPHVPLVAASIRRMRRLEDSAGPFLAILGKRIEAKADWLLADGKAVAAVLGLKRGRYGEHPPRIPPPGSRSLLQDSSYTDDIAEGEGLPDGGGIGVSRPPAKVPQNVPSIGPGPRPGGLLGALLPSLRLLLQGTAMVRSIP